MLYPTELLTHVVNNNNYNSIKITECQGKFVEKVKKLCNIMGKIKDNALFQISKNT